MDSVNVSGSRTGRALNWSSTITERIYGRVREMILQSELRPGEKLTSGRLAQRFGVSSTPIREALRMLEQAGLVEIIAHRGAIVRPIPSVKQVEDIYTVRLALEQLAIRLVTSRTDDFDWSGLVHAAEQYARAAQADNLSETLKWDLEFHGTIVRAAGNDVLAEVNDRLVSQIQMVRSMDRGIPRWVQAVKDHQTIIDALKRHDGAAALAALNGHITGARLYVSGIVNDGHQAPDAVL